MSSLYERVESVLPGDIADGSLPPETQLPSEDGLTARFNVSRTKKNSTGLVIGVPRRGTRFMVEWEARQKAIGGLNLTFAIIGWLSEGDSYEHAAAGSVIRGHFDFPTGKSRQGANAFLGYAHSCVAPQRQLVDLARGGYRQRRQRDD
jgi:hypothetical protein